MITYFEKDGAHYANNDGVVYQVRGPLPPPPSEITFKGIDKKTVQNALIDEAMRRLRWRRINRQRSAAFRCAAADQFEALLLDKEQADTGPKANWAYAQAEFILDYYQGLSDA